MLYEKKLDGRLFIFEIHGDPIPQKQTLFGQGRAYDPSKKHREGIQWQVRSYAPAFPLKCAVQVDITFYFSVPKSTSGIRRRQMLNGIIHHIKKPDADNCAYLITNALKKIFYEDDSQIIDQSIHKRYGEIPKTVVKIIPIESLIRIAPDMEA